MNNQKKIAYLISNIEERERKMSGNERRNLF